VRGLQRRAFLKNTEKDLINKLQLKPAYKRFKAYAKNDYDILIRDKPVILEEQEKITVFNELKKLKLHLKSRTRQFNKITLDKLLAKKSNFHLSTREVPQGTVHSPQITAQYVVPCVRQYMQASAAKLHETRRLITTNFTLFKQFYNIFTGLKELVKPGRPTSQSEALHN
jgi:hypothetical protein